MPPKTTVTRNQIIDGATGVVRRDGPDAITARAVAAFLGCSTQPIYSAFGSIDAVVDAAVDRAAEIALHHTLEEPDPESAFLEIGLAYLDFSRREPELFRFLIARGRRHLTPDATTWPFGRLTERMRDDFALATLSEERLRLLLRNMFVYTHGLATLAPENPTEAELESERELLKNVGGRMIALAIMEDRGEFDLEEIAGRFRP